VLRAIASSTPEEDEVAAHRAGLHGRREAGVQDGALGHDDIERLVGAFVLARNRIEQAFQSVAGERIGVVVDGVDAAAHLRRGAGEIDRDGVSADGDFGVELVGLSSRRI